MVRSDPKIKRGEKQQPKRNKLRSKTHKKSEKNKEKYAENQSTRITRSRRQEINSNLPKNVPSQNTCLNESKENILSLPHFSPRKTRSKSEKIQSITYQTDSKHEQSAIVNEKKQQQTQISVRTQFVKISVFEVDQIVLAKQKYSLPWPAKVLQIEKERVFVYFFGDKRSGFVAKSEIYDFVLSAKAVKSVLESKKKQVSYVAGVILIEKLLGIPCDESIFQTKSNPK